MTYVFAHGSGTAADPYLVETAADLNGVRDYLSAHFRQVADIDLSVYANWEPIGCVWDNAFRGTYDGNNHEITNLTVTGDSYYTGLFSVLESATVKNIKLLNANILSLYCAGGLVGISTELSSITNCHVTGTISTKSSGQIPQTIIGGLVGGGASAIITDCYSECNISCEVQSVVYAGGLIGLSLESMILTNSYSLGVVSVSATNCCIAGGLIGNSYICEILDCFSRCDVSGQVLEQTEESLCFVGGAIGFCSGSSTTNCYSTGSVFGSSAINLSAGGLVGAIDDSGNNITTITSSYYDTQTSGQSDTGKGDPRTTAEMKQQSTYTDWDFTDVWGIDPTINDGYPYLLWQTFEEPVEPEVLPSYTPQSTIKLAFKAGDSDPYPMGIFYADKSVYKVGNAGTKIDGRNSIGKYLKDQSFDERCKYPSQAVSTMLESMLSGAGLTKYYVQPSTVQIGMDFAPNKNILEGIEEILQYLPGWQIREEVDGTVVIGDRTDNYFTQPSRYTFQRDRDIFSREVVTDDRAIYGRVCVHTEDFTVRVYRPVTSELGWTPPAQKTLYQEVPEGTTSMEAATIANSLAASMANSGKVETFVCAFRPQIIPGDEAEILEADKSKTMLGVITQVKHSFGVQGFFTEIVVDSGGRVGKPRFKDIVSAFTPPPATKKN